MMPISTNKKENIKKRKGLKKKRKENLKKRCNGTNKKLIHVKEIKENLNL